VIISEKWNFIFVHIHKTAGDAITEALMPLLGERDIVITGSASEWLMKSLPFFLKANYKELNKHSAAEAIRASMPTAWDNYYKFSFVRNPIDRAISMYKYALTIQASREKASAWRKAVFHSPPGARLDPLNWPAVNAARECNSFSSFIRHEGAMSDSGMLPQWLSVSDSLGGNIIVDQIGKHEHLDQDFAQIRKVIGLPDVPIPRRNISNKYEVIASEADLTLLQDLYKEDLVRFGYPTN
jgi:Sulfotransferase family